MLQSFIEPRAEALKRVGEAFSVWKKDNLLLVSVCVCVGVYVGVREMFKRKVSALPF